MLCGSTVLAQVSSVGKSAWSLLKQYGASDRVDSQGRTVQDLSVRGRRRIGMRLVGSQGRTVRGLSVQAVRCKLW